MFVWKYSHLPANPGYSYNKKAGTEYDRLCIPMELAIWTILIVVTLFFTLSWLFFLASYHFFEQELSMEKAKIEEALKDQIDRIPLLIALMQPHIIKPDQVFERICNYRRQLQKGNSPGLRPKERGLREHIDFLLSVAEKHKSVTNRKVYSIIRSDFNKETRRIDILEKNLHALTRRYGLYRKFSRYVWFPLWWLMRPPRADR